MRLIKIDRPYLIVKIGQAEASALKAIFEALLPKLNKYDSIKFVSKLDSQLKQMLELYDATKLEKEKQEPIIKKNRKRFWDLDQRNTGKRE